MLRRQQVEGFTRLRQRSTYTFNEAVMLYYALVFFVLALIAAALGFGGIGGALASVAQTLAIVFIVLFVLSLIFGRRVRA